MREHAAAHVSDEDLAEALAISSDPDVHADRIREAEKLGATTMSLTNCSGADPRGAIAVYGRGVLPTLNSVRA